MKFHTSAFCSRKILFCCITSKFKQLFFVKGFKTLHGLLININFTYIIKHHKAMLFICLVMSSNTKNILLFISLTIVILHMIFIGHSLRQLRCIWRFPCAFNVTSIWPSKTNFVLNFNKFQHYAVLYIIIKWDLC